ncbi:MAG: carboxynorspermidine decarboxylase, partial [Desulfobulbaceae bacterium]|nr:carboxynorspermidine decarboxylase [Desulfobulbaceae bacterium]
MRLPSPAFIVDEVRLRRNLETLAEVKKQTGCKVLLALKGFAMWSVAPLVREYLDGVCASSPWEARLGREEFGGEVHVFAAAYGESDITELTKVCDEIDFNSFAQWQRFKEQIPANIKCGLRINPECSTQDHAIYDPCAPKSRLGIKAAEFAGQSLAGISGLHFHTLCEQNSDDLARTLVAVEENFGDYLPGMEWVNFGGGHHITREDYDIPLLCRLITDFQRKYKVQVILEPGEAVALNAGVLTAEVLDIVHNEMDIAVLNVSCTAHMPDVLEMPYRPEICVSDGEIFPPPINRAGKPGDKPHTYRLAGLSCLAGDVIGDYSFDKPLATGDQLIFEDMAHYSMVKTTMFNGVQHPAIMLYNS